MPRRLPEAPEGGVQAALCGKHRQGRWFESTIRKATIVAITLVAYKLILIGIGFWASSRNRNEEDFFLGGRALGPVVAAISYSSSASYA